VEAPKNCGCDGRQYTDFHPLQCKAKLVKKSSATDPYLKPTWSKSDHELNKEEMESLIAANYQGFVYFVLLIVLAS